MPDFNLRCRNPEELTTQNFGVGTQQIFALILRNISGKMYEHF